MGRERILEIYKELASRIQLLTDQQMHVEKLPETREK